MKKEINFKKLFFIILISFSGYFLPLPISNEAMIVFSLLIFASLMWVTEAVPLFITSLIVSIFVVLLNVFTFKETVTKFADPILVLFFGGFLIAQAMQDVHLDKKIALAISSRFKNDKVALLVMMFVTAVLSMWISNTATTVVMIPIALGLIAKFRKKMTNFSKATVLGIAYSANIGGIGTIIGSPPNAITVSQLASISGIEISFLNWMLMTIPLVLILIPIAWLILIWIFPFENAKSINVSKFKGWNKKQYLFLIVFIITIGLWISTGWHGLSSSLIAIMSGTLLFVIGLLKIEDLNKINYQILILFGGGLVLGAAMFDSGLSDYFADLMAALLGGYSPFIVIIGVIVFSLLMGALASNTATAAILIPVLIPLAALLNFSPKVLAMIGGVAVSLDFLLPVGTPPNAIAYATGKISVKDMLKAGVVLTIVSIIILAVVARFFWI